MTRKRVTKEEKQQRHEWAMKQIDKGVGFSELASLVAETWGCSRRNARRVVTEAHKEWMYSRSRTPTDIRRVQLLGITWLQILWTAVPCDWDSSTSRVSPALLQ